MAPLTLVNFWKTIFMEMVFTRGRMADNTTDSGRTTKWTEQVFLPGQTAGSMKANTLTIRKKVTVFLLGLTDASMMVTGKMESSTDLEFITQAVAK